MRDGPLRNSFEKLCPTLHWESAPAYRPLLKRIQDRVQRRKLNSPSALLENTIKVVNPDIVYLNTLVLGRHLLDLTPEAKRRIFISHCHELAFTLATMSSPQAVRVQLDLSSAVICCAPCVRMLLEGSYALDHKKATVVPEFLPPKNTIDARQHSEFDMISTTVEELRSVKGKGIFLFGCVGSAISRKGFDLFPLLIKECTKIFGELPFLGIWLGCGSGSEAHFLAEMDLRRMGLENNVRLLPALPSGVPIIRELDVHCLLSREDPYPVVALEASAAGVPTICFQDSGGMSDFLNDEDGLVVDYLDIQAYAKALLHLASHPEARQRLGYRSQQKVLSTSSIEIAAPTILATMQRAMESGIHVHG